MRERVLVLADFGCRWLSQLWRVTEPTAGYPEPLWSWHRGIPWTVKLGLEDQTLWAITFTDAWHPGMGAGLFAVESGFILFIKNYQFPLQINTFERESQIFMFFSTSSGTVQMVSQEPGGALFFGASAANFFFRISRTRSPRVPWRF